MIKLKLTQMKRSLKHLEFYPLTPERWDDFVTLFGSRGACGGCWCMWWRLKRSKFEKQKGNINRQAMKQLVDSGRVPGIIAYVADVPAGWCAVEPREMLPALANSRILKPVDDQSVWSIVCFFIDKKLRNAGLSAHLIHAAVRYVKEQGGRIVEGYPVEPKKDKMPSVFAWTGFYSAFKKAGFKEVARRSETRPIMRFKIED
jgi:hypothetical protein